MQVSTVYSWSGTRRSASEVVAVLRSRGYTVNKLTATDIRLAEYNPDLWKQKHTPFNPASVPGL